MTGDPLDLRPWLAEVEKLGELRHVRGADWNLARNDGSTVVEAYYFMRTSDGVVIKVFNRGVLPPRDTQQGGAQSPPRPAFTTPVFEAPRGKYEWLNSGAYLGTITPRPGGGAVIIRVFRAR